MGLQRLIIAKVVFAALATRSVLADPSTQPADLMHNGDFTLAASLAAWKASPGIALVTGVNTQYLQIRSGSAAAGHNVPGIFQAVGIPLDVKAVRITICFRCGKVQQANSNIGAGVLSLKFLDSLQIDATPRPDAFVLSGQRDGWTTVSESVRVPDGASVMDVSIRLADAAEAEVDLQSVNAIPIDPSLAPALPTTAPAGDDVLIRRENGRTIFGQGIPSVWFIHPYVDVLGHDFTDGIQSILRQSQLRGHPVTIGCSMHLDPAICADEANTIYVFSYKNIDYSLPIHACRLVFLNTWLRPSVEWKIERNGFNDLVFLGSRTLGNDGDGRASDKARWNKIAGDDPTLSLKVMENSGYYLPLRVWTSLVLNAIAPTTQPSSTTQMTMPTTLTTTTTTQP